MGILQTRVNRMTHLVSPGREQRELSELVVLLLPEQLPSTIDAREPGAGWSGR